jgi:tetratricopeptide (TPR) repeat protein
MTALQRSRRPSRPLLLLLVAVMVAAASYVVAPTLRSAASPGVVKQGTVPVPGAVAPVDDAGGAESAPDDRLPLAERGAFWAARVDARPDDFLSLVQLALVDAERARLTADISAYEQALGLVERSVAIVPAYPPTIRARASIRFAIHDFDGALADASSVLHALPTDPTALAILGDAALELGRPADAATAYDRLEATGPGPWLDVRRARLAYATGDPARAVELASRARTTAATDDPMNAGFYAYAFGEFARLSGDPDGARSGYESALRFRSTDLGALVGLARVEAAVGDEAGAIAHLQAAAAIAPQPETLALLGDLLTAAGDAEAAEEQFATVRLTGELSELAGSVYDRQLVAFELDHGRATEATLEAARAALRARPDAAGHDLVAWALHRLGRHDEAAAEIDLAQACGIVDARILFHAGAIATARGAESDGRGLLERARALGPALDPRDAAEADALLRH